MSEVLMTGSIKNTVSLDLTPCSLVDGYDISEERTAYIFSAEQQVVREESGNDIRKRRVGSALFASVQFRDGEEVKGYHRAALKTSEICRNNDLQR
jgi:hypothetical protein